ncbi:MAG TPA: hypothetical protein VLV18_05190 [Terriglobales bacterium]|nr:hypothetical protein [Terriglobales bacterium]
MVRKIPTLLCLLLAVLFLVVARPNVSAARCNVSNVSYSYPQSAAPSQQIEFATGVVGSCVSNGEDYYAVRVDLIDLTSNLTISSSDTPIGYNASAFNVTAHNLVSTPASNVTWPVQIHLYVIRAGGTNGAYLLDYQNSTNVQIQVGSTTLPEFRFEPELEAFSALIVTVLILNRVKVRQRS